MSFGSYQQFCEQRRHTAAATAGAGDAGMSFDIQLPSRYPTVASSLSPRLPPASFYGAVPGANMQPPHAGVNPSQLPSSFFTSQNPASQPVPPGITACNNNDNNNNNYDIVYGAVIVAQSHCKSSPGSCDEYGTAPSGGQPSDQAKRPGLWVHL